MDDNSPEAFDRRSRIVEGARAALLRFGFERTNLADIAAGAGVSRTALYHYSPGKEDVLRAAVEEHHARSLHLAANAIDDCTTLAATLTGLFEAKIGRMLGPLAESSNGVELVDATHRLTGPATRAAYRAFTRSSSKPSRNLAARRTLTGRRTRWSVKIFSALATGSRDAR